MEDINSWRKRAKCRNLPSDELPKFFGEKGPQNEGKKYCQDCPVISLCSMYAIAHDEHGIWGGTTRYEREQLDVYSVYVVRKMYYNEDLLEYRPGLIESLVQTEAQLQEHSVPTVGQPLSKDPI